MLMIGISGVIGSGKSTLSNALLNKFPYSHLESFACPLKKFCMEMLDLTYEQCYGDAKNSLTKYRWKDITYSYDEFERIVDPYCYIMTIELDSKYEQLMTAREVMQYYGQYFRNINEDFFVDKLKKRIKYQKVGLDFLFVDDLRYKNEKKIFDYTIRCIGETSDNHISETDLKDEIFDFYIDKNKQTVDEAVTLIVKDLTTKYPNLEVM